MSQDTEPSVAGDLATFGEALRVERERVGLSQTEAARRARIGRVTLVRWEQGEQPPRSDLLERLRAVYAAAERGEGSPVSRDTGEPSDATITVPRDQAFYWRGVLDSELRSLENVIRSLDATGESLRALRGLLSDATGGVSGFVQSGVLPKPELVTSNLTDAERAALYDERLEAVRARRLAEGRDPETGAPIRRTAGD